jgi:hypothetical protein
MPMQNLSEQSNYNLWLILKVLFTPKSAQVHDSYHIYHIYAMKMSTVKFLYFFMFVCEETFV